MAALHAQGLGRNQIAARIGRSPQTITAVAARLGLSFDRTAHQVRAVESRAMDLKARRAALAAALLEDAQRLHEQLFAPTTLHAFGGRDNVHREHGVGEPLFADKLALVKAASTAIQTSLRLSDFDAEEGSAEARSMLTGLARALGLTQSESSGETASRNDGDQNDSGR